LRDLSVVPSRKEAAVKVAAPTFITLAALVIASSATSATTAGTTRVSISSSETQGDRPSWTAGVSSSGRFVAFTSQATNLVPGDTNERQDAFVIDRRTGRTQRVSVSSGGAQAKPGPDPNGGSAALGMSADGRYVLFRSDAPNLVPGDTNGTSDAFLRDRETGKTRRIPPAGIGVFAGVLSANGRYAVLEAGDDLYRYDLRRRRLLRLTAGANGWSDSPSVSANGRYVAFASSATNLVHGDTNKLPDVFVRDVVTERVTRVSVTSAGKQGVGKRYSNGSNAPTISADGRWVAFHSDMTNLVPRDTNKVFDIFVHDRVTGTTQRVSVSSTGVQSNAESGSGASFSTDGRYVAFSSLATNLVANDHNDITDVFIRDLRTNRTRLVSLGMHGQGDDASWIGLGAAFTRDGRYLLFASWAANLVPGDTNQVADVFLRDLRSQR
jgi:Tol biopolymer transport system component